MSIRPRRTRRDGRHPRLALMAMAIAAVTGVAACSGEADGLQADAALPTEIPPGTTLVVADQQNRLTVALEASGELDKLPFDVEFGAFQGAPSVLEAFRADAIDVGYAGDIMEVQALTAGDDVTVIGAGATDNSVALALAPGVEATGLADLRGKKLGYAEGTTQQIFLLNLLAAAGLTTEDVELVHMSLPDFPDALRSGVIDAAPLSQPVRSRYLKTPGASQLPEDLTEEFGSGHLYVYSSETALSDPATAAAAAEFVAAVVRSYQWINENPQEWIRSYVIESEGLTAEDGDAILASQGEFTFPTFDEVEQVIGSIAAGLDSVGGLPRPVDASEGVDRRFDPVIADAVAAVGASRTRD